MEHLIYSYALFSVYAVELMDKEALNYELDRLERLDPDTALHTVRRMLKLAEKELAKVKAKQVKRMEQSTVKMEEIKIEDIKVEDDSVE